MLLALLALPLTAYTPSVIIRPHRAVGTGRASSLRASAIELSRPPFTGDEIDPFTDEMVKIDPRNDAWLPIVLRSERTKSEKLPTGALRFIEEGYGTVSAGGETFDVTVDTLVTLVEDTELVWAVADDCEEMTLLSPDYWMSERILARQAAPLVLGAVAVLVIGNFVSAAVEGLG